MRANKKLIWFLVGLLVLSILVVGCTADRRPNETPRDNTTPDNNAPNNNTAPDKTTPDNTTPDNTTPDNETPDNTTPDNNKGDNNTSDMRSDDAQKIAQNVEDLNEVDSATCVITGDTAMVGVQFDKNFEGDLTDEVKKKVEDVVKETDKDIDRVVVTADPDLFDRLTTLVDDIGQGRPLTGLRDEIDEILNRIQPK